MSRTGCFVIAWSLLAAVFLAWFALKYWPAAAIMFGPDATARSFSVASESMMPTLYVGDVVRPLRIGASGLSRGMVIVFNDGDTPRIDRVAGLPGDTLSLTGGHVSINGVAAECRRLGAGPVVDQQATTLVAERFPGEPAAHRLLDTRASVLDDVATTVVPPGRLFLLGDDRDLSADSRLSRDEGGVALVARDAVIGRIDTILWDRHGGNVGLPLGRARL